MTIFTSYVDQLRTAEQKLYNKAFAWWRGWQQLNGLPQPAVPTTFEPSTVTTGTDEYIHMVTATAAGADAKKTPMVCLHGFAHGTSVFAMTLAPLAEAWGGPVHALDSPGCGLSSRPAHQQQADSEKARLEGENFFVHGLEEWRKAMGYEKMVLVGHSIGGFCAFVYAEHYPERVERLVLLSPAGVPRPPPDFEERVESANFFFRTFFSMWGKGYSPLSLVKAGAGWGAGRFLVNKYVYGRVPERSWIDHKLYADYMYLNHVAGETSWGGHAHNTLLKPGAFARSPIADRVGGIAWGRGPSRMCMIYGTRDWMDPTAAEAMRDSGRGIKGRVEVCRVAAAGHNVPLDNPLGVVDAILASSHAGMCDGQTFGASHIRTDEALGKLHVQTPAK